MRQDSLSAQPQTRGSKALQRSLFAGALCLCLLNCSAAPDLSEHSAYSDEDSAWPTLLDSETLAAASQPSQTLANQSATITTLQTRLNALRQRAAQLSARPVLSASDRSRLQSALARHN